VHENQGSQAKGAVSTRDRVEWLLLVPLYMVRLIEVSGSQLSPEATN